MSAKIAVVGSINSDLVLRCERLPRTGESIAALGTETHNGGKGANQAVALARLGCDVAFIGRVGNDANGARLRDSLIHEGVDVEGLGTSEAATGLAVILVDERGDNMIILDQGANAAVDADAISEHRSIIAGADAVLIQMEIPMASVGRALEQATGPTFLNPAPARKLDRSVIDRVDYLIPNQTELGTLADTPTPRTEPEIVAAVRRLGFDGTVIVTLGADGAVVIEGGTVTHRARPPIVEAIDTVGAGDAFCAGFCTAVSEGVAIAGALAFAVACGSYATTIRGAQPSMPHRTDADRLSVSVAVDTVG